MKIEVVNDFASLCDLKDNWDRLYAADPAAHFFLSWSWISNWLHDDENWFVVAVRRPKDSHYCALMPLRRSIMKLDDGAKIDRIQMAGRKLCDYTGWLVEPDADHEATSLLAKTLAASGADELELECLRAPQDRIDRFLNAFKTTSFKISERADIHPVDGIDNTVCPYVDLPASWEIYLAGLSSNTRQKLRRFLRKAENSDRFSISIAKPGTGDTDIAELLDLWAAKWSARKGSRLPRLIKTNAAMLRHCLNNGSLLLPVLRDGDRVVSALATYLDDVKGRLLFFMAGRDETFHELPSGLVLHAWSIRWAIEKQYKTYDFLRGDESYKFMFGAQCDCVRHVLIETCTIDAEDGLPPVSELKALMEIAVELHKSGRLEQAELAYRKVLSAEPSSVPALYGLGQLLSSSRQTEEATAVFTRVVKLRPSSRKAWLRLSSCHDARGRHLEAKLARNTAARLEAARLI
jgi:CelD/BcsL family acetyltransferase involved in cellulose biosynthesis